MKRALMRTQISPKRSGRLVGNTTTTDKETGEIYLVPKQGGEAIPTGYGR